MSLNTISNVKWVPRDDTFGARLALIRQRFGWNMKEAALACGLPQNSWVEWESKGRNPRNLADVAVQISSHTGADDYWLMTGRTSGDFPSGPNAGTSDYKSSVVHVDFAAKDRPATRRGHTHPGGRAA